MLTKTTNWLTWLRYKQTNKTDYRGEIKIWNSSLVVVVSHLFYHVLAELLLSCFHCLLLISSPVWFLSHYMFFFSIGQIFTFHGTQTTTLGFKTCAFLPTWYGSQISSSTTGILTAFCSILSPCLVSFCLVSYPLLSQFILQFILYSSYGFLLNLLLYIQSSYIYRSLNTIWDITHPCIFSWRIDDLCYEGPLANNLLRNRREKKSFLLSFQWNEMMRWL